MAQPLPQAASDSQLLNLRVPPHSIDAEQSVLGGLLIDNGAFDKIGDVVTDGDFYRDDHRRIFRHVSRLFERGRPADVVTVDEAIKASEDKDKTGGITYLAALAGNTPSAHNVRRYAEIVRECAVLRKLIEVSTEIADSALNRMGKDVGQLLDEAESRSSRSPRPGRGRGRDSWRSSPCSRRSWNASTSCITRTTLPTSPAFRPATATSIARPLDCSRVISSSSPDDLRWGRPRSR